MSIFSNLPIRSFALPLLKDLFGRLLNLTLHLFSCRASCRCAYLGLGHRLESL